VDFRVAFGEWTAGAAREVRCFELDAVVVVVWGPVSAIPPSLATLFMAAATVWVAATARADVEGVVIDTLLVSTTGAARTQLGDCVRCVAQEVEEEAPRGCTDKVGEAPVDAAGAAAVMMCGFCATRAGRGASGVFVVATAEGDAARFADVSAGVSGDTPAVRLASPPLLPLVGAER
jgi:hypothetical protein